MRRAALTNRSAGTVTANFDMYLPSNAEGMYLHYVHAQPEIKKLEAVFASYRPGGVVSLGSYSVHVLVYL